MDETGLGGDHRRKERLMDRIAQSSPRDRADLFRRAAIALCPERSPMIIEKDFWVCWVLRRLFEIILFRPQLILKGGTSLSKAYNVIERFSEDVDLSLSRRGLGFADDHDPEQPGIGSNEVKRRLDALVAACRANIQEHLLPKLRDDFAGVLGKEVWRVELDALDPQTIIFVYPSIGIANGIEQYIRPAIRLELGARSDDWPATNCAITPYAAEAFPEAFTVTTSCRIHTLEAERTFWEKATLLHAEYHRPKDKPAKERLARHYYDLYQLSKTDIATKALEQMDLLRCVVEHKKVFFRSAWAHFDTAKQGSFHLVPPSDRLSVLRSDYAQMKVMIFGDYPEWQMIIDGLKALEERINKGVATV